MNRARVIPVLLLQKNGLYKTVKFDQPKYVGDPLNALKIFNEKQCDEIIVVDILASKQGLPINYKLIQEMATECFMPLAYGGGINTLSEIEAVLKLGVEKVILNSILIKDPGFIKHAVKQFGSSTLVASVDVKKNMFGKQHVFSHSGAKVKNSDPIKFMKELEEAGIGEIMLNNVDLDGTMTGYDYSLAGKATEEVGVPVIICGGCGNIDDMRKLFQSTHASAAAAGSMFVYHGKHKAVLINYPSPAEIGQLKMAV